MNEELIKKLAIALVCLLVPGGLAIGASFVVRRAVEVEKAHKAKLALVPYTETVDVTSLAAA